MSGPGRHPRPPSPPASPSRHLRWLRSRVPDERLFAPRVALSLETTDGQVLVDDDGALPVADVELESSIRATVELLMARQPGARTSSVRAVRTGVRWWEEHPEVGPLQPIWIVIRGSAAADASAGGSRPAVELALLDERVVDDAAPAASRDGAPTDGRIAGGDYIGRIRARIGRERIFYPWSGLALLDEERRLLLVRLAQNGQWHCPGGGMEIGETPAMTALRELDEETGASAAVTSLAGVWSAHLRSFANGDRIQGVPVLWRGRLLSGAIRPDPTGEIDAMGFYAADALPPLTTPWDARVRAVFGGDEPGFD